MVEAIVYVYVVEAAEWRSAGRAAIPATPTGTGLYPDTALYPSTTLYPQD